MAKKAAAELNIEINARFDKLQSSVDKAANSVLGLEKSITGSFARMGKVMKAALVVTGVATSILSIKKLSDAMGELAEKGEIAGSIAEGFEKLGGSSSQIDIAQKSLLGMVDKYELMRIANQGLVKEIPAFNESFSKIAELGGRLANTLGTDTVGAIEQVTKALETGKTKQLASVGITINATKAFKDYGDQIGVNASELDEYQKKEARQLASIAQLDAAISKLAPITDSLANAQQAVSRAWEEGSKTAGIAINENEALIQVYREFEQALDDVDWAQLGKNAGDFFATLLSWANDVLPKIIDWVNSLTLGFEQMFGTSVLAKATTVADTISEIKENIKSIESASKGDLMGMGLTGSGKAEKLKALNNELGFYERAHASLQEKLVKEIKDRRGLDGAIEKNNTSLKGGIVHTERSSKAIDNAAKAAKKAADEIAKLQEKWADLMQSNSENSLKSDLDDAIESINHADFQVLKEKLAKTVYDGFVAEWQDAIDKGAVDLKDVQREAQILANKTVEDANEKMSEAITKSAEQLNDEFAGVFDTWARTLNGIADNLGLDLTNIFATLETQLSKEQKTKIMQSVFGEGTTSEDANAYASIFQTNLNAITSASEKDKATGSNAGTGGALGAAGGTAIGAIFGGPAGAAIGGAIGQTAGEIIGGFISRGSQNQATLERKQFISYIEDAFKKMGQVSFYDSAGKLQNTSGKNFDFTDTSSSRFSMPDWGASMKEWQDGAQSTFIGLGEALEETLGLTEDVGSQIGFLLGEQLGGNIDNARLLVQQLGLSLEDLEGALISAGLSGEMSWHEVEVSLQGVNKAFEKGKEAIGDVSGAMDDIVASGGRGIAALKGVRDSATEAMEKGANTIQEMGQQMIAMGTDPALVEDYLQALEQRGIKTLEQLENASDRLAGGVVADLASNNDELRKQWEQMGSDLKQLSEQIKEIPTEKDIEINVKTNFDSNTEDLFNMQLDKSSGLEQSMPETSGLNTSSNVRIQSIGTGSSSKNNYYIDARGADAGVEQRLRNALRETEERAVRRSINSISENSRRGGRF